MNSRQLIGLFNDKGIHVFTLNDVVRMTGVSRDYARLFASRLVNRGVIHRAIRGHYYTDNATMMEISSNLLFPSYISLMPALYYYGFTTQQSDVMDVITTKRHKDVITDLGRVKFHTLDVKRMFGYYRTPNNIFVAEPEKAIADSLFLGIPQYGYVEEAFERASKRGALNMGKLAAYAEKMQSRTLDKRMNELKRSIHGNKV